MLEEKLKKMFPMLNINVEEDERGVTNITSSLSTQYMISGPICKSPLQAKRAMAGDLTVLRMESEAKEYRDPLKFYWINKLEDMIKRLKKV